MLQENPPKYCKKCLLGCKSKIFFNPETDQHELFPRKFTQSLTFPSLSVPHGLIDKLEQPHYLLKSATWNRGTKGREQWGPTKWRGLSTFDPSTYRYVWATQLLIDFLSTICARKAFFLLSLARVPLCSTQFPKKVLILSLAVSSFLSSDKSTCYVVGANS